VSQDPRDVKGFQILDKVAANALADDDYRKRLINDPKTVLVDEGLVVPDGIEIVIVENTDDRIYLVLPSTAYSGQQLGADECDVRRMHPLTPF
jgi:hypothetical protein